MPLIALSLSGLAIALTAAPALAWDATGHEVVARIAWNAMSQTTRQRVIDLLERAPADSRIADLEPNSGPRTVRDRTFFSLASTWADAASRSQGSDAPAKGYGHPNWHYINIAWSRTAAGRAVADTFIRANEPNVVERLAALERSVVDPARPASQRAVDLAWILHLVGDVHQPLHASTFVSAEFPDGDRGGTRVRLRHGTLHSWWDHALTDGDRRRQNESRDDYIERVANAIAERYPRAALAAVVEDARPIAWARESLETAEDSVYTSEVVPFGKPPAAYRQRTTRTAELRCALAGYRLAALLDQLFGSAR
ncbi:MAG TPA: S1/P1 nuclease [Gemmatimonadaceae bacterium]|nr:S1/P1 nuclease [Gemmatimonadaceae bacterium]